MYGVVEKKKSEVFGIYWRVRAIWIGVFAAFAFALAFLIESPFKTETEWWKRYMTSI